MIIHLLQILKRHGSTRIIILLDKDIPFFGILIQLTGQHSLNHNFLYSSDRDRDQIKTMGERRCCGLLFKDNCPKRVPLFGDTENLSKCLLNERTRFSGEAATDHITKYGQNRINVIMNAGANIKGSQHLKRR